MQTFALNLKIQKFFVILSQNKTVKTRRTYHYENKFKLADYSNTRL